MNSRFDLPPLELKPSAPPRKTAEATLADPAPGAPVQQGRRWSDGVRGVSSDPNAPWSMAQHWPELVAALSEQAVESSNLLLRALDFLVGAGRLRRTEAKALADAMFQLRETSLRAQQITRLAGGRIRQAKERVDLMEVIRNVLQERQGAFEATGVQVSSQLKPADVLLDPPVAVSLVNAVLDWAVCFSKELTLTLKTPQFPAPARLQVVVSTAGQRSAANDAPGTWASRRGRRLNDGLYWMLLRQMATSAGLLVQRTSAEGAAIVSVEFPNTFLSSDGLACMELLDANGKPVGGKDSWVLIVTGDTALQRQAVVALRKTGIDAAAVDSLGQARLMAAERKPDLIVTAYDTSASELAAFRAEAIGDHRCPVVEITQETPAFEVNGFDGNDTAKVGRDQLSQELPATVLFELVKVS